MHIFPDSLHCIYLPRIIPDKICCQKFKLPSLMVSMVMDAIAAATVSKGFFKVASPCEKANVHML